VDRITFGRQRRADILPFNAHRFWTRER
jgi:hypothetical protein